MTKKDFELIAEIVKIYNDKTGGEYLIKLFADRLQKENPRFNYRRFWIACGGSI